MGVISRLWPARWSMNPVGVLSGFPSLPQPMLAGAHAGWRGRDEESAVATAAQVVAERAACSSAS